MFLLKQRTKLKSYFCEVINRYKNKWFEFGRFYLIIIDKTIIRFINSAKTFWGYLFFVDTTKNDEAGKEEYTRRTCRAMQKTPEYGNNKESNNSSKNKWKFFRDSVFHWRINLHEYVFLFFQIVYYLNERVMKFSFFFLQNKFFLIRIN